MSGVKENIMSVQGKIFTETYGKIRKEVKYDSKWMNGTGYFDGAVHMVKLGVGEMAKSKDDVGRRIIFIGTRFGTIVVFDRYAEQIEDGVWVANKPNSRVLQELMSGTSIGISEMTTIMGSWGDLGDNIGHVIEDMANELKAA